MINREALNSPPQDANEANINLLNQSAHKLIRFLSANNRFELTNLIIPEILTLHDAKNRNRKCVYHYYHHVLPMLKDKLRVEDIETPLECITDFVRQHIAFLMDETRPFPEGNKSKGALSSKRIYDSLCMLHTTGLASVTSFVDILKILRATKEDINQKADISIVRKQIAVFHRIDHIAEVVSTLIRNVPALMKNEEFECDETFLSIIKDKIEKLMLLFSMLNNNEHNEVSKRLNIKLNVLSPAVKAVVLEMDELFGQLAKPTPYLFHIIKKYKKNIIALVKRIPESELTNIININQRIQYWGDQSFLTFMRGSPFKDKNPNGVDVSAFLLANVDCVLPNNLEHEKRLGSNGIAREEIGFLLMGESDKHQFKRALKLIIGKYVDDKTLVITECLTYVDPKESEPYLKTIAQVLKATTLNIQALKAIADEGVTRAEAIVFISSSALSNLIKTNINEFVDLYVGTVNGINPGNDLGYKTQILSLQIDAYVCDRIVNKNEILLAKKAWINDGKNLLQLSLEKHLSTILRNKKESTFLSSIMADLQNDMDHLDNYFLLKFAEIHDERYSMTSCMSIKFFPQEISKALVQLVEIWANVIKSNKAGNIARKIVELNLIVNGYIKDLDQRLINDALINFRSGNVSTHVTENSLSQKTILLKLLEIKKSIFSFFPSSFLAFESINELLDSLSSKPATTHIDTLFEIIKHHIEIEIPASLGQAGRYRLYSENEKSALLFLRDFLNAFIKPSVKSLPALKQFDNPYPSPQGVYMFVYGFLCELYKKYSQKIFNARQKGMDVMLSLLTLREMVRHTDWSKQQPQIIATIQAQYNEIRNLNLLDDTDIEQLEGLLQKTFGIKPVPYAPLVLSPQAYGATAFFQSNTMTTSSSSSASCSIPSKPRP